MADCSAQGMRIRVFWLFFLLVDPFAILEILARSSSSAIPLPRSIDNVMKELPGRYTAQGVENAITNLKMLDGIEKSNTSTPPPEVVDPHTIRCSTCGKPQTKEFRLKQCACRTKRYCDSQVLNICMLAEDSIDIAPPEPALFSMKLLSLTRAAVCVPDI